MYNKGVHELPFRYAALSCIIRNTLPYTLHRLVLCKPCFQHVICPRWVWFFLYNWRTNSGTKETLVLLHSQNRKRHSSQSPGNSGTICGNSIRQKKNAEERGGERRWRGRAIETEVKQEWTEGHSLVVECQNSVQVCSLVYACLPLPLRLQTNLAFISTRSVSNKTSLLINNTSDWLFFILLRVVRLLAVAMLLMLCLCQWRNTTGGI